MSKENETLEIITYGHPTLRAKAETITEFNHELRDLARIMERTMVENDGAGLAANQVDKPIRLLVIHVPKPDSDELLRLAVVNPEITETEGTWEYEEGCLSIPDIRDVVTRPERIKLKYQDLDGNEKTLEADGLLSRVLQHEIDHLNGILFTDHLSPVRRSLHNGKLKRIMRENEAAGIKVVV